MFANASLKDSKKHVKRDAYILKHSFKYHISYSITRKLFINTCVIKSKFPNIQVHFYLNFDYVIGYVLALPMLFIAWWNTSQFMPLTWLEKILGPFVQKAFMKIKSSHLHNKFRWACWINIYDNCLQIVPTFRSHTIKWYHSVLYWIYRYIKMHIHMHLWIYRKMILNV